MYSAGRKTWFKNNYASQAKYVEYGFGQVEPNHLSAQRTGQIYGQLPADPAIMILEQGQFVKYDYAKGLVNFEGAGEWMLVYNETKLYREEQADCEFAMLKDNYQARVYSPFGHGLDKDGNPTPDIVWDKQSRFYNGVDAEGNDSIEIKGNTYKFDDVTADGTTITDADGNEKHISADPYEMNLTNDPYHIEGKWKEAMMPVDTTMVPRVFKTNVGDIFTTNTINAETLAVGDTLKVGAKGILEPGTDDKMTWQVVKVYTMPDAQKGVKIMRIA